MTEGASNAPIDETFADRAITPDESAGGVGPTRPSETSESQQSPTGDIKEQAQDAAENAVEGVRETARRQVDQRSTEAGERVSSIAQDLRSVSAHLREQDNKQGARAADAAADRAERAGSYLSEADADRILSDVEDFARRQPWLVLAGGVAVGVAAARMLKASSSQRYQRATASNRPSQPVAGTPAPKLEPTAPSGGAASAQPAERPAVGASAAPPQTA
jgi:hypothetical protein